MSKPFRFPTVDRRIDRSTETLQAVLYGALRDWSLTVNDTTQVDTWVKDGWTIRLYETSHAVALLRDGEILVTLYRHVPEQVLTVLAAYDAPIGVA